MTNHNKHKDRWTGHNQELGQALQEWQNISAWQWPEREKQPVWEYKNVVTNILNAIRFPTDIQNTGKHAWFQLK